MSDYLREISIYKEHRDLYPRAERKLIKARLREKISIAEDKLVAIIDHFNNS